MTKFILFLVLFFTSCSVNRPDNGNYSNINFELKAQLEEILRNDQGIREILDDNLASERKIELLSQLKITEADIEGTKKFILLSKIDSTNLAQIESIVKRYGYPGKALVGEPANSTVFYVIQHSEKINDYLPLIRKATECGDISYSSLAMMEDRSLMYLGLEQIYGTQIKGKLNKNGEWTYFLWPLKNADSINIWRKRAGINETIEEYLKNMDVEFKLYKISELDEI